MERLTSLKRFANPQAPDCAILVRALNDNYASYESVMKIKEKWKDCQVRFLYGGHVLGFLLHTPKFADFVVESL